jgi:hypothetical protein
MQPQPPPEIQAAYVPEWALLDIVDFTDGTTAVSTVNPNVGYASSSEQPAAGFGSGLRSQLDVLTNSVAARSLADPMNPQGTNNSAIIPTGFTNSQAGISNTLTALANLQVESSWSSGATGWFERRDELDFPTNVLLLPSEITEIVGVADFATETARFKENELRLGALFPGLGTKSRFFKIYAVGEALEGGAQEDADEDVKVAATALLETLVEVDDSTEPVSIRTIYQQSPPD